MPGQASPPSKPCRVRAVHGIIKGNNPRVPEPPGKVFPWHTAGQRPAALQSWHRSAAPQGLCQGKHRACPGCTLTAEPRARPGSNPSYLAEAAVPSLLLLSSVFPPALPRWHLCFPTTFSPVLGSCARALTPSHPYSHLMKIFRGVSARGIQGHALQSSFGVSGASRTPPQGPGLYQRPAALQVLQDKVCAGNGHAPVTGGSPGHEPERVLH